MSDQSPPQGGSQSHYAQGKTGVVVYLTREEREAARVAAARAGKSTGPWVLDLILRAIEEDKAVTQKEVRKNDNSS